MRNIKSTYIQKYIKSLADDGMRMVIKAFDSSTYNKNQTQNLHDSYGSAVFYNKSLVDGTERYLTSRAIGGKYNYYTDEVEYGRNEIKSFFRNYKPSSDGIVLVVAVAMFYGKILEKGGKIKYKYKVISGINSDINLLAKKYNATVRDINL